MPSTNISFIFILYRDIETVSPYPWYNTHSIETWRGVCPVANCLPDAYLYLKHVHVTLVAVSSYCFWEMFVICTRYVPRLLSLQTWTRNFIFIMGVILLACNLSMRHCDTFPHNTDCSSLPFSVLVGLVLIKGAWCEFRYETLAAWIIIVNERTWTRSLLALVAVSHRNM